MNISAHVENRLGQHLAHVVTEDRKKTVAIPPKPEGQGSSINGGELLFLALATCYCNDIYREAHKRGIQVQRVQVEVTGQFGREGEGARNVTYNAIVDADAPREDIVALMQHTDTVAEIQNTLRNGVPVRLAECQANAVGS